MNKRQRLFFSRNLPVLSSCLLKIHLNKVVSEPDYFLLITFILSSLWLITMETRGKTNAEFQDEVNNILVWRKFILVRDSSMPLYNLFSASCKPYA